ncbi:8-amino-7-oxononanoate synthase isoform X2 [Punica granatum]|uniref:8-amino-7-oxononanoate synthase isoform X2 n=1 Tax=Punica granatum TaxID=22663 RepID=A0A6P8D971_PUNGR|nr:8-amino-7-oxononanoate synthase isoform X2 [Punica granatum]
MPNELKLLCTHSVKQMEGRSCCWDAWVEEALAKLHSLKLLRSLRPIHVSAPDPSITTAAPTQQTDDLEVFDEMQPRDRLSVEVDVAVPTIRSWLLDIPSCGEEAIWEDGAVSREKAGCSQHFKKLILFSGNDYLGLSSHPTVGKAAAKAAQEHGMGPRGSALVCGYTNYHRRLEFSLAELKKKEDCLLCPTGFAANMAVMVAIGNISRLLSAGSQPLNEEKVAIFSDALNHASIIDGIHLAEKQHGVEVFVYRHCDMSHLDEMLSTCSMKKRVVVTDRRFFRYPVDANACFLQLCGLIWEFPQAHGTFVCGENGGGVAEAFNCEGDVDICVGTLSKAAGCHGGFVACSKRWKQLILSRGRSFIYSTAAPVPFVAAAHAAVIVARKETWRRREIWKRVKDFQILTGIPIASPIISLVAGTEEKALEASRHLLGSGFHVTAIRPPTVPPNSCRLRITLSAVHTTDDLKKLTEALSCCIDFREVFVHFTNGHAARL